MKKIIITVIALATLAGTIAGISGAFFHDEEISTDNCFCAMETRKYSIDEYSENMRILSDKTLYESTELYY